MAPGGQPKTRLTILTFSLAAISQSCMCNHGTPTTKFRWASSTGPKSLEMRLRQKLGALKGPISCSTSGAVSAPQPPPTWSCAIGSKSSARHAVLKISRNLAALHQPPTSHNWHNNFAVAQRLLGIHQQASSARRPRFTVKSSPKKAQASDGTSHEMTASSASGGATCCGQSRSQEPCRQSPISIFSIKHAQTWWLFNLNASAAVGSVCLLPG